ncbi:hypothetical protein MJO28_014717 [Puccinia striiformis f. sp. tritici]|uniref:Uncharacterized protein n=1 Tax=Puccinia striiformis f. sp. tritici TaxID=168172 RepID=A0ACC0DUF9_9BASI|nr:hypothetical protein MJO28_014717 [Puccinia striiformis f. sp. tritici]
MQELVAVSPSTAGQGALNGFQSHRVRLKQLRSTTANDEGTLLAEHHQSSHQTSMSTDYQQDLDGSRSNSQDSYPGRFESYSLPATDPARQSFASSSSSSASNQFGTGTLSHQSQVDHHLNSASRSWSASVSPTELTSKSVFKLGLGIFNPTQTHKHHQSSVLHGCSNDYSDHHSLEEHANSDSHKPYIPLPLKIIAPSYRRSISAPFTSTGLVSLDPPGRLDSITEDGTLPPASAQPDTSFNFMTPLQTPMPFGGANDSREFSSMRYPIESSPPTQFMDLPSTTTSNPPDQSSRPNNIASTSQPDQIYRKWSGSFYVWLYDTPPTPTPSDNLSQSSPTLANSPPTSSNLSNNLIGGISRHFFQQVKSGTESKVGLKKEKRVPKLGLLSGLTKQRETVSSPQLETSSLDTLGSPQPNLDPSSLSEHLDALVDRSTIDPSEKSNQTRSLSNSKPTPPDQQQPTKPKKHHFSTDSRIGRKKVNPDSSSGGTGNGNGSITSQLALGPGKAMNSQGVGSGQWKLVQGVITEDGHFTLYAGSEVVLYRIHLPSYRRTDIRMVHQSIFGRPHCGVITRRTGSTSQSAARTSASVVPSSNSLLFIASHAHRSSADGLPSSTTPHQQSSSSIVPLAVNMNETAKNSTSQQSDASSSTDPPELSIYICMPNSVLLESWLVICKCFSRPDDFRHLYPRSSKKNQNATTSHSRSRNRVLSLTGPQNNPELSSSPLLSNTADGSSTRNPAHSSKQGLPERVRIWRGVEIQLVEGRKMGESRHITVNNIMVKDSSGISLISNATNRVVSKEERRNSTGGFLPTGSQASLLSINKEALYNKSSKFIISDPGNQPEHQNEKPPSTHRYDSKNIGESESSTTGGFSSHITSTLTNKVDGPSNGQSSAPNFEHKPAASSSSNSAPLLFNRPPSLGSSKLNSISPNSLNDHFYFVELDWDGEIIGRSTIKRNSNPFWNESFKFSEIGSFKTPLVLNVYQIKKNVNNPKSAGHNHSNSYPSNSNTSSHIALIGQSYLDFKSFEKNNQLQLWLPIYSNGDNNNSNANIEIEIDDNLDRSSEKVYKKVEIMGEINLSITVIEQVVLGEPEYAKMMNYLNNDNDIELPLDLANMAVGELDRLAELLIRIYEASDRLFTRFSQLAAIEINGDVSTASILFRGSTLLTKMLEAYMRILGRSFLESSVGPTIRRICMAKIDFEIDPSKLKPSLSTHQKEKIVHENSKELKKIANEIWQTMYINRSKCPNRLRKIFVKIQELVGNSYDDQDMRLTSISAFVFLRFFVPAILNPRLFNLIQFQPDIKSQRTLTLLAKTLQGLGNLTLFGIKEPWMSVMNEFITTQLDSFRDYISFIASESDSIKPEWTSKEYEGYGLPFALRASLPDSSRDGVPTLPHLLDPVRDCSLLASLMTIIKKKISGLGNHVSVLPPKITTTNFVERHSAGGTGTRPRRNTEATEPLSGRLSNDHNNTHHSNTVEFLKICNDLYNKSERRYLKIIQSETKDPNKSTSTTSATATTVSATHQDRSRSTILSSGIVGHPTESSTINSRTSSSANLGALTLGHVDSSTATHDRSITRSPSNSLSFPNPNPNPVTTRGKRSHTITTELGSSGSGSAHLPEILSGSLYAPSFSNKSLTLPILHKTSSLSPILGILSTHSSASFCDEGGDRSGGHRWT